MFIVIVDFQTLPENRAAALEVLLAERAAITAIPGNLSHRVFANAGSDRHVGLIHEWETQAAFETYLASPGFARAGQVLRPLMTGAPQSRRMTATLFEDVTA